MKRSGTKKRIFAVIKNASRPMLVGILLLGVAVALFNKQSIHATSDRAKKVAGVFIGGGAGGGIAAIAGSAKWFPLGFGVGGLAGGLIARRVIRNRRRRRENATPYESKPKSRRSQRNGLQASDEFDSQPTFAARRHIKVNN